MIDYSLIIAKKSTDIDKSIIDPWSGNHAASGLLLGMLGFSNISIIFLAILWEIIENSSLGITTGTGASGEIRFDEPII